MSLRERRLNKQTPSLTGQHVWPGERMPQSSDAELAYQALDPTIIIIFKQALATEIKRYPAAFVQYSHKDKNDSKIPLDAAEAARRPVRKTPEINSRYSQGSTSGEAVANLDHLTIAGLARGCPA